MSKFCLTALLLVALVVVVAAASSAAVVDAAAAVSAFTAAASLVNFAVAKRNDVVSKKKNLSFKTPFPSHFASSTSNNSFSL